MFKIVFVSREKILFGGSQSECFFVEFGLQITFPVNRMEGLPTQPKTSKQTKLSKVYLHLLHFPLAGFLKEKANVSELSNLFTKKSL